MSAPLPISRQQHQQEIPKSLKTNTCNSGVPIAHAQGMGPVPQGDDLLNQAERLLTELIAIEQWNTAFWRNRDPDVYETIAFVSRKKRRSEIIRQMVLVCRSLLRFEEGRVCPYCQGKGRVLVEVRTGDGPFTNTWVSKDCPLCEGTGRLYGSSESGLGKCLK
jgi:hypothetical protein